METEVGTKTTEARAPSLYEQARCAVERYEKSGPTATVNKKLNDDVNNLRRVIICVQVGEVVKFDPLLPDTIARVNAGAAALELAAC
jgi:hypothetical protein